MSAPPVEPTAPPPRAHSFWRHARAALLLLLLLILVTGIAYPLAIGGIGVVLHRDVVNTTNNSTSSTHTHLLGHPRAILAPSAVARHSAGPIVAPGAPGGPSPNVAPTLVYSEPPGEASMRSLSSPSLAFPSPPRAGGA